MKFSNWEGPGLPAPMLGEHTVEVLGARLGIDEEQVDELARQGLVSVWPVNDPAR
jgi:crotonobetainyl-CoA:carnitine CoA-transferase CaiB-like acyl-CoA transferase